MEAVARQNNIRVSPRKLRLVVDVARGKSVARAIDDLRFSRNRLSSEVVRLIRSAVNNASRHRGVDVDKLVVKKIMVDQGATMKRFMTRARGSGSRILKRMAHLTVVVGEPPEGGGKKSVASRRKDKEISAEKSPVSKGE